MNELNIHKGTALVLVGLLVILNEIYKWIPEWSVFIGIILIILGFLKMMHTNNCCAPAPKTTKKKKK